METVSCFRTVSSRCRRFPACPSPDTSGHWPRGSRVPLQGLSRLAHALRRAQDEPGTPLSSGAFLRPRRRLPEHVAARCAPGGSPPSTAARARLGWLSSTRRSRGRADGMPGSSCSIRERGARWLEGLSSPLAPAPLRGFQKARTTRRPPLLARRPLARVDGKNRPR